MKTTFEDGAVLPLGDVGPINALSAKLTRMKCAGKLHSYGFYFADNRDLSAGDFANDISQMIEAYSSGKTKNVTSKVLQGVL